MADNVEHVGSMERIGHDRSRVVTRNQNQHVSDSCRRLVLLDLHFNQFYEIKRLFTFTSIA